MNEILNMVLPLIAGLLLGILFFGGLWFTVKKLSVSKLPALLFLGSFFFRVSIVLIGFYFVGLGDWKKLIVCLLGFILARFAVIYYTKSLDQKKMHFKKEAIHEA